MNEIANLTFIHLTEVSYDYGLITRNVFIQRIFKLYELNDFDIDSFPPSLVTELEQISDTELAGNENEYREFNFSDLDLSDATKINEQLYSKDNVLHLISKKSGKCCKWKFNEYDADDKPSIPHGHGIENGKLKLDPYRGLIFNIGIGFDRYQSKEDDEFIKYLWNDNDFRNLATLAINYHIVNLNKHPLYWRDYRGLTHDPRKLPRRRR